MNVKGIFQPTVGEQRRTFYLAKGMMKVVSPPSAIESVVDSGYLVAVTIKGAGGGLLHLSEDAAVKLDDRAEDASRARRVFDRFFEQLRRLDPQLTGAKAQIIGGSDILGIMPVGKREVVVSKSVKTIVKALADLGVEVEKTAVGGANIRKVHLDITNTKTNLLITQSQNKESLPRQNCSETNAEPKSTGSEDVIVNMGLMKIASSPERLVALLGSCVGIAIYDTASGIGGLAHVMLPNFPGDDAPKSKYADSAVPALIRELKLAGADTNNLRAAFAGGANVLFQGSEYGMCQIAQNNISESIKALRKVNIKITAEDNGGDTGRKMFFDLSDFSMKIKLLNGAGPRV
jgi:chemotaxis protein CheD